MRITSDIQIVIRSVNERTTAECKLVIDNTFQKGNVKVISETPFSRAISKGFELGLKSGKTWLLCIDADVLVDKAGITQLLEMATGLPEQVFEVQGLVRDKFFPVSRPAGNHLYRLKYAKKALKCIPKEGASLRPEGTMLKEMARRGYPWYQSDVVVGLHDFEQYYYDIFRKCFLHAKKHSYLLPKIMPYWLEQAKDDPDFQVAILAAAFAQAHDGAVSVAKDFGVEEAVNALKALGLEEKGSYVDFRQDQIGEIVAGPYSEEIQGLQELMAPSDIMNRIANVVQTKKPSFVRSKIARGFEKAASVFTRISDSLRKS